MLLTFKTIKLHNFLSFADAEVALDDMGYAIVEGRNHCKLDNAFSNGSGKSSIFNAVCFALTGETTQGISTGLENLYSNPDDCWVELEFRVDDDEFIVRRIKTPKSDMKIWINGVDKSGKGIRESSKVLAEHLPDLTSDLVNSIIILGQGLPSKFTNNTPAKRKEILEGLTKSDFMIQSIKDKLDARLADIKVSLREKEDARITVKSKHQVYMDQLCQKNKELEESTKLLEASNLDQMIAENKQQLEDIKAELAEEKDAYRTYTDKFNELIKSKTTLQEDYSTKLHEKTDELDEYLSIQNKNISDLSFEIKMLEKELDQLHSMKDTCPTCGQKLPDYKRPDTREKDAKLTTLRIDYEGRKKAFDDGTKLKGDIVKDLDTELREQQKHIDDTLSELDKQKRYSMAEQDNLSSLVLYLTNELARMETAKANYDKLVNDTKDLATTLRHLEDEESNLTMVIDSMNSHLDVVQQMISLARRDFRGILLSNVINYIDNKVKIYSKEVFGTEELNFSLDGNAIDINYCGKPYENLSGGEKQKIDIIIQIALREVLSKQLNIHSNLLVLDEVFDNLDLQGCNKVLSLISSLTDIDSIFIISHHTQDLELTRDTTILVEKNEDGISSIKIV